MPASEKSLTRKEQASACHIIHLIKGAQFAACICMILLRASDAQHSCPPGYHGGHPSGTGCVDIDECADNPCDELVTCTNNPGSYECGLCPPDYFDDGNNDCVKIPRMEVANGTLHLVVDPVKDIQFGDDTSVRTMMRRIQENKQAIVEHAVDNIRAHNTSKTIIKDLLMRHVSLTQILNGLSEEMDGVLIELANKLPAEKHNTTIDGILAQLAGVSKTLTGVATHVEVVESKSATLETKITHVQTLVAALTEGLLPATESTRPGVSCTAIKSQASSLGKPFVEGTTYYVELSPGGVIVPVTCHTKDGELWTRIENSYGTRERFCSSMEGAFSCRSTYTYGGGHSAATLTPFVNAARKCRQVCQPVFVFAFGARCKQLCDLSSRKVYRADLVLRTPSVLRIEILNV
eukprot:m.92531 g.92531  ORF g.92531 m.92531 type:complete len:406 (+) comp12987_c0_seq24:254-1471(+)